MLEITNTVVNKDGQLIKDKIVYAVHYIVTNGTVNSIQCAISYEKEGEFSQLGYIRKENGRVNTDFDDAVSLVKHLTVFEEILKEIDKDTDIQK